MSEIPYAQVPPDDASARSLFFLASELDPSPEAAVQRARAKRRRLLEEGVIFPSFGLRSGAGTAMNMQGGETCPVPDDEPDLPFPEPYPRGISPIGGDDVSPTGGLTTGA